MREDRQMQGSNRNEGKPFSEKKESQAGEQFEKPPFVARQEETKTGSLL
jgi:hypothetical protein